MTYEAWRITYQSSEQAARAAYAECVRLQAKINAMETDMEKLFCDCKTDAEKSAFFLSGRAVETGVIAAAISNDVAMAYHRCSEFKKENDALRAKIAKTEQQELARLVTPTAYRWRYRGAIKWQYGELTEEAARLAKEHNHEVQPLYALPGAQNAPNFADAYQGAMEEVAIWKKRALEAEDLNRKFIAEINGPTHRGEPVQNVPSAPREAIAKILTEVMNIAVANGADSRSMPDEYVEVAAWLCGVPGAKGEKK